MVLTATAVSTAGTLWPPPICRRVTDCTSWTKPDTVRVDIKRGHYLASGLPREGLHHFIYAIVHEEWSVVEELPMRHFVAINEETVRYQGVPVVKLAELQRDAVTILELGVKQHYGVKLQFQKVSAELLHVLLYHYLYRLSWKKQKCSQSTGWRAARCSPQINVKAKPEWVTAATDTWRICGARTCKSVKLVIGTKEKGGQAFLTDDDETGRLEELLVAPGWVFGLQDVADPVVLPEPQSGVERQTWDDSKHFLPDGKRFLRQDPGWVVHPDGCVLYSGGVDLTSNYLMGEKNNFTLKKKNQNVNFVKLSKEKPLMFCTWYLSFPSLWSLSWSWRSRVSP